MPLRRSARRLQQYPATQHLRQPLTLPILRLRPMLHYSLLQQVGTTLLPLATLLVREMILHSSATIMDS